MGLPDLHGVNILGTACAGFATLVTLTRLFVRWRSNKLWWDDAWAFGAMFNAWILVSCVWVLFAPPTSGVTQHARVVAFYAIEICFTLAIWAARLSIWWTVIRITPGRQQRRYMHMVAAIFVVFAIMLCAQKFWVCIPQPGWTNVPGNTCDLGKQVAVSEIVTDVIGDIVLVAVPVRLLWNIKLTNALRIRLITVFSMSIVTTIVSLCQNYYLIHDGGIRDFIVSHVEIETAVTVCNLNVLVAVAWRLINKSELEETNETKHGSTRPPRVSTIAQTLSFGNRGPVSTHQPPVPGIRIQTETYEWSGPDDHKAVTPVAFDSEWDRNSTGKSKKVVDSDSEDIDIDLEGGQVVSNLPNAYPMKNYSRNINLH